MRNPLPHLALAALIFAPAASAAPGPGKSSPLAFKRDDWKVVDGSASGPAVKKACAGTLAVTKAAVSERNASWCAKLAMNCSIPLFCVQFDAEGSATVSPVDKGVLDLTVYHSPLPKKAPDYRLNRGLHDGKFSPAVAIRDPKDGELMASTTARPVPPGDADHQIVPLTDDERYWLTKTERDGYEAQIRKQMKPEERVALDRTTRAQGVAKNLPSFARSRYASLTKNPIDPSKVSSYLDSLIAIRDPKDLAKLEAIKKGKGAGSGLQMADARQQYDFEMSHVPLDANKRPLLKVRGIAVQKVQHFRALMIAAGHTPTTRPPHGPSGAVVDLLEPELDWLMPEQRGDYAAKIKTKLTRAERLILDKQNRGYILENLPASGRSGYEAAIAEMTPAALEGAIRKVPHWSGADTELNDKEVAALAAVKNAPAPKGYGQTESNNAAIYYKYEMSHVYKVNGVLKGSAHLQAHEITVRYRAMVPAATDPNAPPKNPDGTVGKTPTDPNAKPEPKDPNEPPFTPKDTELKSQYDKEILQAGKDPAKIAAVQDKYKKILAARRDFDHMTDPVKQKKFCEGYKDVVAASGPSTSKDFAASGGKAKAQLQSLAAQGDAPVAAPASSLDPYIKSACAELLANDGKGPTPGAGSDGKKPTATVDSPLPCGAKKAAAGNNPSAKAGTDSETPCPEAKPFDSGSFYKDLASGMSFGVLGLVLGSFFGGPLVMAAAALALGGGAFMLSKHINKPDK